MTTRTYYLPAGEISRHVLNAIISKVGCSIGAPTLNKKLGIIQFPITCNDKDVKTVENILKIWGMMEE
jgi:hypothetical protein